MELIRNKERLQFFKVQQREHVVYYIIEVVYLSIKSQGANTFLLFSHCVFEQWCSKAFKNVNVVPPDVGAVHQVNLEYLSRVVHVSDGLIYPDSVVGTDSHTTMINGLGILGWGKTI